MRYRRSFIVAAPIDAVDDFHRSVEGFRRLVPPGTPYRIHHADEPLEPGGRLDFTLWLGPVPVRWEAALERLPTTELGLDERGFVDRQARGPFRSWVHEHRFTPLGPKHTRVVDHIEARLRRHPVWGPVGCAIWLGLPILFRFRALRTKRALAPRRI